VSFRDRSIFSFEREFPTRHINQQSRIEFEEPTPLDTLSEGDRCALFFPNEILSCMQHPDSNRPHEIIRGSSSRISALSSEDGRSNLSSGFMLPLMQSFYFPRIVAADLTDQGLIVTFDNERAVLFSGPLLYRIMLTHKLSCLPELLEEDDEDITAEHSKSQVLLVSQP
jgi:hypothetical protein